MWRSNKKEGITDIKWLETLHRLKHGLKLNFAHRVEVAVCSHEMKGFSELTGAVSSEMMGLLSPALPQCESDPTT